MTSGVVYVVSGRTYVNPVGSFGGGFTDGRYGYLVPWTIFTSPASNCSRVWDSRREWATMKRI